MAATGSIIVLIIYLVLMSGFWIGLMGLWRGSRGAEAMGEEITRLKEGRPLP